MMSGGIATYMVTEPQFPWELHSRLLYAAAVGKTASFTATSLDDAREKPYERLFKVKVKSVHFETPVAFEVEDDEHHIIQIKLLPSEEHVTFNVFI